MEDMKEGSFRPDAFRGMSLNEDDVGVVLNMIAAINVTASKLGCRAGEPTAVIELVSEVQKMTFDASSYILNNLSAIQPVVIQKGVIGIGKGK